VESPHDLTLARLLRADAPGPPALLDDAAWEALARLAHSHRVAGLLLHTLRARGEDRGLPADTLAFLESLEQRAAIDVLHLQSALGEFRQAAGDRGIDVLALKGVHLGATVYPSPTARPMCDVDVLVSADRALEARDVALALGYRPLAGDDPELELASKHHFDTLVRGSAMLEIHWRLTPPSPLRRGPETEALFARAVPFALGSDQIRGLCPTDLLLHLCSHASYQHLFEQRLGALWDIALVISRHAQDIQWDALIRDAEAWDTSGGTHLALQVAADLTGIAPPAAVFQALTPTPGPDVIAAARAQIFRGTVEGAPVSHHVTRLMDPTLPLRQRLDHLVSRLFLTGPALTQRTRRLWRQRGLRAARLVMKYSTRLTRRPGRLREAAHRRNALASWLEPDGPGL
jgi:hypothetical protein